jgi:lambda repressor-like predicted transcriptional regulator
VDLTAQLLNLGPPGVDPFEHFTRITEIEQPESPPPPRVLQKQHRLEAQQIAQLVAKYMTGASVRQLTRDFKIHRTTVLNHLEREGVPRRPNTRKLTDEQVAEAAELYEQGWSMLRLGRHYEVDDETVRRTLKRSEVVLRPRRGR